MFALQNRIDTLNALNSKLDLLLQSQLYAMPFKGHHELLKWSFKENQLTIKCVHLSAYVESLEIVYENETVSYEPKENTPKSIFQCQRPTRPQKIILNLNAFTMVQPIGKLDDLFTKWLGEDMAYNIAFIQSVIIQYATAHKLLQDNIICSDSLLKSVFNRDKITLELLDELVLAQTKKIEPIEIELKLSEDHGGNFLI